MNDPALEGGDYCPCYTITFGEDGRVECVKFSGAYGRVRHWMCDEREAFVKVKHGTFSVWEFFGPNAGSAMPSSSKRRGNAPIKCEKQEWPFPAVSACNRVMLR